MHESSKRLDQNSIYQTTHYNANASDSPGGAGYSNRTEGSPAAFNWLRTVSAAELPRTAMSGVRLPSWSKSAFSKGTSTLGCSSFNRAFRSVEPFSRGYLQVRTHHQATAPSQYG